MRHAINLLMMAFILVSCDANRSGEGIGNEADMRGYIEGATSPEMELEAAKEINRRFSGYSVTAFNVSGDEVFPHLDGNYDAVHLVTISFADSNVVASRVILNRGSLTYIYGE